MKLLCVCVWVIEFHISLLPELAFVIPALLYESPTVKELISPCQRSHANFCVKMISVETNIEYKYVTW